MGDRPRQRFRRPSRLQSPPRQRGGGRQAPGAPSVEAGTPTLRGSFFSPGAVRKNTRGSESGALSGGVSREEDHQQQQKKRRNWTLLLDANSRSAAAEHAGSGHQTELQRSFGNKRLFPIPFVNFALSTMWMVHLSPA